jgi:hypothetical protein
MIERWKVFVVDIREKGQTPTVSHISEYVRKRVKAEFDPDFGDLQRDLRPQEVTIRHREEAYTLPVVIQTDRQ